MQGNQKSLLSKFRRLPENIKKCLLFDTYQKYLSKIKYIIETSHPRETYSKIKLNLESLPKTATLRKLNDLIKRARLAKVNIHIIFSCS
jgi:hypothetical protein